MNRAVFLDRDGVIVEDNGLVSNWENINIIPSAPRTIAELKKLGFLVIVVTNQAIVARGLASEAEINLIHEKLKHEIIRRDPLAVLDGIYMSPFHPNATVEQYRKNSDCRKPYPGMLLKAAKDFKISLEKSYMVGDRISDVIAGNLAKCTTILISGHTSHQEPIISDLKVEDEKKIPNFEVNEISQIIKVIQNHESKN